MRNCLCRCRMLRIRPVYARQLKASALSRPAHTLGTAVQAVTANSKHPSTVRAFQLNMSQNMSWHEYNRYWEDHWSKGVGVGEMWDKGVASPALRDLLARKSLEVEGKRVFVPGCGRGYDPLLFAAAGAAAAVGLDLSASGVKAANEFCQASELPADMRTRVRILEGDFFSYEDADGPFDVGYDYTFLCALHPDMRTTWASSWQRLLRPGGELVTLIFPVRETPTVGPPWPVTPELYRTLLEPGFECISIDKVPPEQNQPGREGQEYMGRWRRKP